MHYLRLTERQVFFNRVRLYAEESDIGVWFTRPLTRKILDAAAKNVQHFCQLHTVLVEKLLEGIGLTAGIDCYLGSPRDLSDELYDDYCH